MWTNFFDAGGFGMYPTVVFGFLLLSAIALHAFRREPRFERAVPLLAGITFGSGLLGTCVGICNSVHYMSTVPREDQLRYLAMGTEESLHNMVLALIILVLAGLIHTAASFRRQPTER